jgi:hypothetical protein
MRHLFSVAVTDGLGDFAGEGIREGKSGIQRKKRMRKSPETKKGP